MFREVKVLVQKHVARFKLRLAGTKAHVLKYEADLLLQGSGLGEVPPVPSSQLPLPPQVVSVPRNHLLLTRARHSREILQGDHNQGCSRHLCHRLH